MVDPGISLSLSDVQMRHALRDYSPLVISYPDLIKLGMEKGPDHILEIIEERPICICILTKKAYGHWVCLFRNTQGVQFFDSYALAPDDELKWNFSQKFKDENYEWYPFLTSILLYISEERGEPVFYNSVPLQAHGKGIATCGRHCILRILFYSASDIDYPKIVEDLCQTLKITDPQTIGLECHVDPDHLTVLLTDPLLADE
jgi:hypothetical protein